MALGRPGRALLHLQNLSETYISGEVPPIVWARKADALTALGRYREAATYYRLICEQIQPSADGYYRLAQAELRARRSERGKDCHRNGVTSRPAASSQRATFSSIATRR